MRKTEDTRRKEVAWRIVQDLNDAGLLLNPWTKWEAARRVVTESLRAAAKAREKGGE